mgnify:CR=1 FL=1
MGSCSRRRPASKDEGRGTAGGNEWAATEVTNDAEFRSSYTEKVDICGSC